MIKRYNKLVRDKIPETIEAAGQKAVTETLCGEAYLAKLHEKLEEEMREYLESGSLEELADLGEVMHAILDYKGVPLSEFQRIRQEKLEKRGGFTKRILLKEVID